MNAVQQCEQFLKAFLADERSMVVAMKGDWGVGKTHLWKRFIAANESKVMAKGYAYASLFGIQSIAELRRVLFTQYKPFGSRAARAKSGFGKVLSGALRTVEISTAGVGLKNTEVWAEMLENQALQEVVICIDDLERKEDALSASALLGFIANLRDEYRCKVALVYNEKEAESNEKLNEALSEYREKVIDREIVFAPDVSECFRLVFGRNEHALSRQLDSSTPWELSDQRSIEQIFAAAECANIRVMRKAKDALDYFARRARKKYPNLWPSFARNVTKLAIIHYVHGNELSLEDVTDHKHRVRMMMGRDKSPEGAAEYAKYQPLEQLSYHTVDTDQLIVEFFRFGFADWQKHGAALEKAEESHKSSALRREHRKIWDLLWQNFRVDQETFVNAQLEFIRKHRDELTIADIDGVLTVLKEMGEFRELDRLLDEMIEGFVSQHPDFEPSELHPGQLTTETQQRIIARLEKDRPLKAIPEAIRLLTKEGGWNSKDLRHLKDVSEEEFKRWVLGSTDPDLLHRLREFRSRFANDAVGGPIVQRLEKVLHGLAADSAINARRVYVGVRLPQPPKPTQ